jgi:hypothetical protein
MKKLDTAYPLPFEGPINGAMAVLPKCNIIANFYISGCSHFSVLPLRWPSNSAIF